MSPRRSRLLVAAVLIGQLVLLAGRAPDRADPRSSLLEGTALRLVAPFVGAVTTTGEWFASLGSAWRSSRRLAAENQRLRAELVELRRKGLRAQGLELEAQELADQVRFARESRLRLRAAQVAFVDPSSWLRTLLLRVGTPGARRDQVVISEQGVVGRVIQADGPWAKVQLLTDRAAAAGVYLEKAHYQGLARGAGPAELELDYVPRQVTVEVGDRVLTAGIDGVYPRGLLVGEVSAVEPGDEMFHHIDVRPAVDFAELARVFLVESETPPVRPESKPNAHP